MARVNRGTADDRGISAQQLLARTEKRLRRVGQARASQELKRAYITAADAVHRASRNAR